MRIADYQYFDKSTFFTNTTGSIAVKSAKIGRKKGENYPESAAFSAQSSASGEGRGRPLQHKGGIIK